MNDIDLKRRRLLAASAIGAGVAATGGGWWILNRAETPPVPATGLGGDIDKLLQQMDGAGRVGAWVREAHPALGRTVPELIDLLRQRLELGSAPAVDAERFSAALERAIRADFAAGDTLTVRDWHLSRTEALLALLRQETVGITTAEPGGEPVKGHIVDPGRWGPAGTHVGHIPNPTPRGHAALWFHAENAPRWAEIAIAGERLHTRARNGLLVATLRPPLLDKIIAKPGRHPITLHDDMANTWQPVGKFRVDPEPERYRHPDGRVSQVFCPIRGWGPGRVKAGKPKNTRPDGSMGFWIDTDCAPDNTRLLIGERSFDTYVGYRRVTAKIPPEVVAQPDELAVTLLAPDTGETLPVGKLRIE